MMVLILALAISPQQQFTDYMQHRDKVGVEQENYLEGKALASYGPVSAAVTAGFFPVWEAWKAFSRLPDPQVQGLVSLVNPALDWVCGTNVALDPTTSPVITPQYGPVSLTNILVGEMGVWDQLTGN